MLVLLVTGIITWFLVAQDERTEMVQYGSGVRYGSGVP